METTTATIAAIIIISNSSSNAAADHHDMNSVSHCVPFAYSVFETLPNYAHQANRNGWYSGFPGQDDTSIVYECLYPLLGQVRMIGWW